MQSERKRSKEGKKSGLLLFILLVVVILFLAYKAYLKSGNESFVNIDIEKLISKVINKILMRLKKQELLKLNMK